MIYIWIAIVIILAIMELMTSSLIPIWFSISGIFAIIISIFTSNYIVKLIIFTLFGLGFLTIFRPILLKRNK